MCWILINNVINVNIQHRYSSYDTACQLINIQQCVEY